MVLMLSDDFPSTRREGLWTFRLPTLHSHSSAWFANPNKLNGAWYASHCILYHYVDATRRAVHPTHTMDVPCRVVFMPSASGLASLFLLRASFFRAGGGWKAMDYTADDNVTPPSPFTTPSSILLVCFYRYDLSCPSCCGSFFPSFFLYLLFLLRLCEILWYTFIL